MKKALSIITKIPGGSETSLNGDTEIFPVHSFAKTDACADKRLIIREPRIETDNV